MDHHETAGKVRAFSPTGDEWSDVERLRDLLGELGDARRHPDVRLELISVFERHPEADLGSPGPIVHALEVAQIDEHVDLVAASLRRRATVMTVWMAERCFRGEPSPASRAKLLDALTYARSQANPLEEAEAIADALREYRP